MITDLNRILRPESIAVVGASKDETKRGYQAIATLQAWGYDGAVYPVNPKYDGSILGLDVYPTVSAIPDTVDLAFVATPAEIVPGVLEDCGEADVAGAVIIAAGFSEMGAANLEREMVETAHEHGMRLIGPNINGIANVHDGVDLVGMKDIPRGDLALLSQSGNVFLSLVNEAIRRTSIGFSYYIALGNEADLKVHEYLPFFADHDGTDGLVTFVEGMADGRSFLQEAATFTTQKPIVALKGGRSEAGRSSAASHTASLAGDEAVIDAVYDQAGVVRVDRSDELLPVAETLTKLPPAIGRNIGILSDGGGHATHCADALVERGLDVPTLETDTRDRLLERVPQAPNVANPVDLLTLENDLDRAYDFARVMLEDPGVDALMLIGMFGGYGSRFTEEFARREIETAEMIADLPSAYGKPVIVHSAYAGLESAALDELRSHNIPVFESLDVAVRCVEALCTYGEHRSTADRKSNFHLDPADSDRPSVTEFVTGDRQLSEYDSKRILDAYGAPVVPYELTETADEAVQVATRFGGAVAMKVVSPDITHKTEANGVRLAVEGTDDVREAFESLRAGAADHDPGADVQGVLVSPMREADLEVIVGVVHDEEVGPVLMFGLGGVFVEVLEDVAFRAIPLTRHDAESLIDDIDSKVLLEGFRGSPPVDTDALVDLVLTVSELVEANPDIHELDLNPVFVSQNGVEVVDASISLADESADTT